MNGQDRAPYLTAIAHSGSLTGLPFTLAAAIREEAHTIAAELVCDLGERSMRPHREKRQRGRSAAGRLFHSWPAFLARHYTRETWRGIPGPLPVKVILCVLAMAEPSPYGEMALAAFGKWNGGRKARKATAR